MVHRSLTLLTLLCIIALACGCQQRAVISGDQRPVASQPEDAGPVEETPEAETPEEPEESSTQAVSPRYAKEAERLAARGQEALDNGEWLEANEAFSRAVELDRGNIDAWIGRGRVLTGLAQPEDGLVDLDVIDDAVNSFSNAIEIQSDLADAWFGRAQAESVLGRAYFMEAGSLGERGMQALERAIDDFTQTLALDAENAEALLGRAEVYEAQGEYEAAIADFKRVLVQIPGNTTAQMGIDRCRDEM
ncbi:MAG: tetratricopeptide repeat protein [Armatimonadetes bacterium]|nr:tetratricopeptide repeat protein [Armatimonadota bacterium]